jgi:hypothetical protein
MEDKLFEVESILDAWVRKVTVALGETDEPRKKETLYQAMLDYGCARYDALALLEDPDAQEALCSELISWMTCAGDHEAARKLTQVLIGLLEEQDRSHEVAQATYRQGKHFFDERNWEQATVYLQQALLMAEQLQDNKLCRRCETYLKSAELFQ